ncbi:hypothetical protein OBBRIDRAFT_418116 [Obba rivulosa]|uniref:Uncharacterized protein n=1 Tax=Obba rivulosa TaxID=1052685 RepID=A0A8E2B299_9APHY|nr:hypothetical protein OBBRIDRAFT_418116 [Obba rivulosa]
MMITCLWRRRRQKDGGTRSIVDVSSPLLDGSHGLADGVIGNVPNAQMTPHPLSPNRRNHPFETSMSTDVNPQVEVGHPSTTATTLFPSEDRIGEQSESSSASKSGVVDTLASTSYLLGDPSNSIVSRGGSSTDLRVEELQTPGRMRQVQPSFLQPAYATALVVGEEHSEKYVDGTPGPGTTRASMVVVGPEMVARQGIIRRETLIERLASPPPAYSSRN